MKAITVFQPHALLLVMGIKPIENRSWVTNYRGRLAIHAGLNGSGRSKARCDDGWIERYRSWGLAIPADPADYDYGAVIGSVCLYDCKTKWQVLCPDRVALNRAARRRVGDNPWATGPKCWMVRDAQRCRPMAVRGDRGMFEIPDVIMAERELVFCEDRPASCATDRDPVDPDPDVHREHRDHGAARVV